MGKHVTGYNVSAQDVSALSALVADGRFFRNHALAPASVVAAINDMKAHAKRLEGRSDAEFEIEAMIVDSTSFTLTARTIG
jgi:hypothetical protein